MRKILLILFGLALFCVYSFGAEAYKHPKEDARKKCSICHDMGEGKPYVHRPVRSGACSSCHNVYGKTKNLLRTSIPIDVCVLCHSDKRRLVKNVITNVHPPVKQDCTNCHDPHAGDRQFRLKADKRKDLCLGCHIEKKEWIESVKNKHGAIDLVDGGCFYCHDPHYTGRKKMLRFDTTRDLCLSCHNRQLRREEDGAILPNMAEYLSKNKKWHGPIIKGECTGCHNPHGSNNSRMLKRPYPEKSTTKFKQESYVCFKCHPPTKITQRKTTTDTNYRIGDKNLHTVHVNDYSIVCGTCHDFHAVSRPIPLLKDKTKFGGTKFDLRYIKTPDGGSCNPICHNKREYDRRFQPK